MTRRTLVSCYALAESVELCLQEHEGDIAADPALQEARLQLRQQLRLACDLARQPARPNRSLTGEKRKLRDLLVQALVELHGIIHSWAITHREERARELYRNATHRIHRLGDTDLRDHAHATRALLDVHRHSLEKFGLDDATRRAFSRLLNEFERNLQMPQEQSDAAASPSPSCTDVLGDLVAYVDEVIDPLVWRYEGQAPRFVRAYRAARRTTPSPGNTSRESPHTVELHH